MPRSVARALRLPLILFVATCGLTFLAGATNWNLHEYLFMPSTWSGLPVRATILENWQNGLIYSICVMTILLCHEMGHYVTSKIHRVPASLPYFLPIPNFFGTMGAVIRMDGLKADRREIFDIGLAGPIAGLIAIAPVVYLGVRSLDLTLPAHGALSFDLPLLLRAWFWIEPPVGYQEGQFVALSQMNPYFMAAWMGLLVTGLNMIPVSQLDGGHVTHALFGPKAKWIGRALLAIAPLYALYFSSTWTISWMIMIGLLLLIGIDHPPTRDDTAKIGPLRWTIGFLCLAIPILCFPLGGVIVK
ncbi:MAG TPA: site-2 protease family protein [Pirellulaceae bacterium]|jgi:membrane-associated protease RseP (regulator of RpoE activity)|nr:site-2 protease family protein [Pirellulaceae bacterium]